MTLRPPPSTGEPAFRPRRYHTKSRNGCFNCKKRRIKCSEALPACNHCLEKGLSCEYPPGRSSPQPASASLSPPSQRIGSPRRPSQEVSTLDPHISTVLEKDDVPGDVLLRQGYLRSDVLDLLHHFVAPTSDAWIGSNDLQSLVQHLVRGSASNAPYLLYSALAFAAAHKLYLEPSDSKYRIAAPYHYQHSLRKYFRKLSDALEGDDAESLYASCQLHSFLAFLNAASSQNTLGIDLGWVRSTRGVRFIVQSPQLMASLQQGDFAQVTQSAGLSWHDLCGREALDNDRRVAVDLQHLRLLESVCSSLPSQHQDVCLQVVQTLHLLVQVRPEPAAIGAFMSWIYRLPDTFVDLLEAADPVASLIIGMWCALFSRIDEWWIVGPAKAECRKVCEHIDDVFDARFDNVVAHLRTFVD